MKKPITHSTKWLRNSDFEGLPIDILRWSLILMMGLFWTASADAQPYCTMVCNDNLNVSLSTNCEATITYDMILEDPDNSYHCLPNGRTSFVVIIMTEPGGNPIPTSPKITADYIGQTLYVKVKHWDTGNSCWSTIHVEDKQLPGLTCPADVTVACTASTDPSSTGFASANDCSDFSVTYTDQVQDLNCGNPTSRILRTWKVADIYGNERICTQNINISRPDINAVSFPKDRDNIEAPAISCTDGNTDPTNAGQPMFNGLPVENTGSCHFTVTFNDQIIQGCEGSFKILRRWVVIDHCTSIVREHTQLIKVVDETAPVLNCPSPMTVSANGFECSASVILPPAVVSDVCSNTITVETRTPGGTINGNGGVISSLPAGVHVITYAATDACGNVGTCELFVTVVDNAPPVMICDELTVVTLTNDGTAVVRATIFDDGTADNCCDVTFDVKRMDEPDTAFGATITFGCEDAGTDVNVILRGTDCNGNSSICMVVADIDDKTGPAISCPSTATVYCSDDATDLNITGEPTGFDACGLGSVSFSDQEFLDDCNTGYILRTFTIDDANDNSPASCTQRINIIDTSTVVVNFPPDYTTSNCGSASDLQPEDLPAPFNRPVTSGEGCGLLAINFTDEVFTVAPPACFKILRTWTVINWCEYDVNNPNGPGRYQDVQVIKVLDNDAPTFTCPQELTFDILENSCTTTITLPELADVDDCSSDITTTVNGDLGSGRTFQNVDPGTYNFTYTVSDGCGNAATCDVVATVRDAKPPTAYCNNGLVITLMPTGMIDIWAVDFNAGSFDNCTEQDNLQFRISTTDGPAEVPTTTSLTFTCDNIGTNSVRIWVGDNNGNFAFCETFVQIQDPNEACLMGGAVVGGLIRNEMGDPVEDVTIRMNGGSNFDPITTQVDGRFRFDNVVSGADYTVAPEKTINLGNGISTFDQVLILKHIIGNEYLNSPYKLIAADINRSGTITNADMIALRKVILTIDDEFENNSSWRFIDANYQFYSDNPLNENFPEVYSINNFNGNMPNVDFMAIKVGDVNSSAIPNALLGSNERNNETVGILQLNVVDQALTAGEEVTIDFRTQDFPALLGYQFTLDFSTSNLEFVKAAGVDLQGISEANFGLNRLAEGIITTSFAQANASKLANNDVLFSLTFQAKTAGQLSDYLQLNSRQINVEAYNEKLELLDVQLAFQANDKIQLQENAFALYQNQPNPFGNQTTVDFYLPTASAATLSVYDISGQLLKVYQADFASGKNSFNITKSDLNRSGTLYYRLQTAEYTATRKMILLE